MSNLYTQIGMIMLVGLGAKNAILIVEFAMEQRAAGLSIYEAGVTAARLRFRAVMMTALSFLLGVVPLLIASGAGAASQQAIGIAVFGGMLIASTLGVILTPVLYVAIQAARERVKGEYTGGIDARRDDPPEDAAIATSSRRSRPEGYPDNAKPGAHDRRLWGTAAQRCDTSRMAGSGRNCRRACETLGHSCFQTKFR